MTAAARDDPPIAVVTTHIREPGYTIVASVYSHHVDFNVHAIAGWCEGAVKGQYDVPNWAHKDTYSDVDWTDNLEEAAIYLHGFVKWDGCSNWHFDEQERCMLHGCSREDLINIGAVLAACWDSAETLCPEWNSIT